MVEEIKFFKDPEKTLQVYPDMKIDTVSGEAKNFTIEDASNASAKFTIYGETEQDTATAEAGTTVAAEGHIKVSDVDTTKEHKIDLNGNTKLYSNAETAGTTLTGEGFVSANNVDTTKEHVITTYGNTKQNQYNGNQLVDFPNPTNLSRANYTYNNNILTVTTDTSQTGGYNGINYNITDIVKANSGKILKFTCKSVDLSLLSKDFNTRN